MSFAEMLGGFGGIRFVEDSSMATQVQVRFPRSKRRRIRKKWAKRAENWRLEPWPDVYQLPNGVIIGHPCTIARLKRAVAHAQLSHPYQ